MTNDLTQPIETPPPGDAPPPESPPPADPMASSGAAAAATGTSRMRWLIAIGAVGIVLALTAGALVLLGAPASPEALRYVPGDAAVVAELRMDLPGDQMQNLGNLLAHFPGFADSSTLGEKLDESLSRFVSDATGATVDYRADLKPWLNGPLFLAVRSLDDLSASGPSDAVISATTNGAVDCTAVIEGASTHETYRGLDLVIGPGAAMACVVDGRQALLGTPESVRGALDAKADGTGMDKSDAYQAARSALGGDRLATVYLSGAAIAAAIPDASAVGTPEFMGLIGGLPEWIMAGVRAESDALVFDTVTAPLPASTAGPSLLPMPAGHASTITGMLPGDTLAFVEIQGAGVALQNALIQLGSVPELAAPLAMLDGLGGSAELVGWIEDVGIAVSIRETEPNVALLLVATSEAAATERVTSLTTILGLMGLSDGVTVRQSTISGVSVTTVTITDLDAVLPPGTVPGMNQIPLDGPVSFSIAARGRAVILTSGEAAMTAILDAGTGTSLADQAAFKQAVAFGLQDSQTTVYLAAGATIDAITQFVPADELEMFGQEVAPYVDPLEAILMQASTGDSGGRSRLVVTVTTP